MSLFTRSREGAKKALFAQRRRERRDVIPGCASSLSASSDLDIRALSRLTPLRSLRLCANQFSFFFAPSRLRVNQIQAAAHV